MPKYLNWLLLIIYVLGRKLGVSKNFTLVSIFLTIYDGYVRVIFRLSQKNQTSLLCIALSLHYLCSIY